MLPATQTVAVGAVQRPERSDPHFNRGLHLARGPGLVRLYLLVWLLSCVARGARAPAIGGYVWLQRCHRVVAPEHIQLQISSHLVGGRVQEIDWHATEFIQSGDETDLHRKIQSRRVRYWGEVRTIDRRNVLLSHTQKRARNVVSPLVESSLST